MPLASEKGGGSKSWTPQPNPPVTSYVPGLRPPTTIQPAERAESNLWPQGCKSSATLLAEKSHINMTV